jgi:hypothetical protein
MRLHCSFLKRSKKVETPAVAAHEFMYSNLEDTYGRIERRSLLIKLACHREEQFISDLDTGLVRALVHQDPTSTTEKLDTFPQQVWFLRVVVLATLIDILGRGATEITLEPDNFFSIYLARAISVTS